MRTLLSKLFVKASAAESQTFHPSNKCPECGTPLMRKSERETWQCPNLDCPAQIRARIAHWCSPGAMDISADAQLAAMLVARGLVRDVAELYRLKASEIAGLPGMTQAAAKEFFDAITASMKREGWRVLFGLNIPGVTQPEAKLLCEKFGSVDNVFAAGAERLMQTPGVSETAARGIVHWHGDSVNRKLVKRLARLGVNFNSAARQ